MLSIKSFKLKHALFFSLGLHLLLLPALSISNEDTNAIKPAKKKWETVRIEIKRKPIKQSTPQKKVLVESRKKIIEPQIKPIKIAARPVIKSKPAQIVKTVPLQVASLAPIQAHTAHLKKSNSHSKSTFINKRSTQVAQLMKTVQAKNIQTPARSESTAMPSTALFRPVKHTPPGTSNVSALRPQPAKQFSQSQASSRTRIVKAGFNNHTPIVRAISQPRQTVINTKTISNTLKKTQLITAKNPPNDFSKYQVKKIKIPNLGSVHEKSKPSNLIQRYQTAHLSYDPEPRSMTLIETVKQEVLSDDEFKLIWRGYASTILEKVQLVKKYPALARKKEIEGRVVIAFQVDRHGIVQSLSINESSGYDILDNEALHAVQKAGPYDPIPNRLALQTMSIKIPISFVMR